MFNKEVLRENMLAAVDAGYRIVSLYAIEKREDGTLHCTCEQAKAHKNGYRDKNGDPVPDCSRAGKHPVQSGYTRSPSPYSEDRVDIEIDEGGINSFGVLLHFDDYQLIVIDVDNHGDGRGGDADFARLCDTYPDMASSAMACGLVVQTSNGGRHYYFKAPPGQYVSHLEGYENIDIKVSGFVAGPGSQHRSGSTYDAIDNATLDDITDAPESLLELLRAPEKTVSAHNGKSFSADAEVLKEMLSHLKPDMVSKYDSQTYESYDAWLHVGMSLHAGTNGSTEGLGLWDEWSQNMSGYNFDEIQYKWLSFGRNDDGKSIGYLYDEARNCGWIPPVREGAPTGQSEAYVEIPKERPADVPDNIEWPSERIIDTLNDRKHCDLTTPPGGVGAISEFIMRDGYKPRPALAVAAALYAAATAAAFSLKTISGKPVPTNTIMACAAGSGTGKNAVINNVAYLLDIVGMSPASNGEFKSGQAVTRSLVEHQAANFLQDEFGEKIGQVIKAHGSDSQSYLAQVITQVMSIYSQSDGKAVIERELARSAAKDVRQRLKEIKSSVESEGTIKEGVSAESEVEDVAIDLQRGRYEKKAPELHAAWLSGLKNRGVTAEEDEKNPPSARVAWEVAERFVVGRMDGERESLQRILVQLRGNYLTRPYLSLFGVSTGETFFPCMTPALIKNGLWGRAMLFMEHDDAPWPSEKADGAELLALRWNAEDVMLRTSGGCANHFRNVGRVEEMKERETVLEYAEGAREALNAIRVWESVKAKSLYAQSTGATALYNRSAELTERLAVILAAAEPPTPRGGRCEDGSPYVRVSIMTVEHVRWAYAMIEADTMRKNLLLVAAMDDDPGMIGRAIECRLKVHTPRGKGNAIWEDALIEKISTGAITRGDVKTAINKMVDIGRIVRVQVETNPFDAAMGATGAESIKVYWDENFLRKNVCNDPEDVL